METGTVGHDPLCGKPKALKPIKGFYTLKKMPPRSATRLPDSVINAVTAWEGSEVIRYQRAITLELLGFRDNHGPNHQGNDRTPAFPAQPDPLLRTCNGDQRAKAHL